MVTICLSKPFPRVRTDTFNLETHGLLEQAARGLEKMDQGSSIMKPLSLLDWCRMLRAHHQWTMFQAVRYALWLLR